MSHLLKSTSSVDALLESGDWLIRNCDREGNGTRQYAETVAAAMTVLKDVAGNVTDAGKRRDAGYDAMRMAETRLDDAVRSAFFSCRKYDWTAGSEKVLEKVFPGAVSTPVLKATWRRKEQRVTMVLARLTEVAGDSGILTGAKEELARDFAGFTAARDAYEKSMLEYNRWNANGKLGRKKFAHGYNVVYYRACGEIGRTAANRLFPSTQCARKKSAEPEILPVPEPIGTAA